ncbi:NAD(P)/FAD-dependent oxidoreductase [Gillisia sp. M10.2A]|uniref:NAD(P)/FAD-dependent oxidoreductase n=1 Tax=Gillisia lutea TaxID=2909668 RepID=A0ABS9EFC9_9FLAO|nr:NAD(P)/FAD-dependent oxidoreductase [Gillisia lutea]MCF4101592.1 NAD(P)/FAD-dependent oxidoreductase [Gillisia lutea]
MKNGKVVIIGGGLAGLTAAIHLVSSGIQVTLIEKESFPHHKVCGEYLSRECLPYLQRLGIDVLSLQPSLLNKFSFSTASGRTINSSLELRGLGISRYNLDYYLFKKAKDLGVIILQDTAIDIQFMGSGFKVKTHQEYNFEADFVLGAFGKRSNIDKNLNRDFITNKSGWLAIKSHYVHDDFPDDTVALHNFKGGYCGISKTETEAINVCYLATYKSFKEFKNPSKYKEEVLCENPHLRSFFNSATSLFDKELSIAQISFTKKSLIYDHILMLGDASGLIHPLCGNGMAMAIHSAKIASESILYFYTSAKSKREDVEKSYREQWLNEFSSRLRTGRVLQKIFLNPGMAEVSQSFIKAFPGLLPKIINKTHGSPIL